MAVCLPAIHPGIQSFSFLVDPLKQGIRCRSGVPLFEEASPKHGNRALFECFVELLLTPKEFPVSSEVELGLSFYGRVHYGGHPESVRNTLKDGLEEFGCDQWEKNRCVENQEAWGLRCLRRSRHAARSGNRSRNRSSKTKGSIKRSSAPFRGLIS